MKLFITLIILMLLVSCQKRYKADEIVDYLPLESPKVYKVLKDTTVGDYLQIFKIVVDKEYFNRTREMIKQHKNFKNLGCNVDTRSSYKKAEYRTEAYLYEDEYFYIENEKSSPRLSKKFLYFRVYLKKDSIIEIICRPH